MKAEISRLLQLHKPRELRTKDGSHIVPIRICGYLIKHMCKEEERWMWWKLKVTRYLLFKLILRVLSYSWSNPSIPTSIFSRSCCVGKFITLIHIWLFCLSLKGIITLHIIKQTKICLTLWVENIPSRMQENMLMDWTQRGNSEKHWHPCRLGKYMCWLKFICLMVSKSLNENELQFVL